MLHVNNLHADKSKLTRGQDAFDVDASSVVPPMMGPSDSHKLAVGAFDAAQFPPGVVAVVGHHAPPSRWSSITFNQTDTIFRACLAAVLY